MKAAILFLIGLGAGTPALAGMAVTCMDRLELEAALIDWYDAAPIPAPDSDDPTSQIWVAADLGVWAMIRHLSSGQSCVLRKGDHWQSDMGSSNSPAINRPPENRATAPVAPRKTAM